MPKRNLKQRAIIWTILTIATLPSYGQTFDLSDTTLEQGDILISYSFYWDLDKATLRQESYPFLDSLTAFLQDNKKLTIEISNHCDERWPDRYSTCLTCNRAKSIMEYLQAHGINSDRLIAKGFNDKKPIIVGAKTEEEHQRNRRTEFKILLTDFEEEQ